MMTDSMMSTLEELITTGPQIKAKGHKRTDFVEYITGEDYEFWISRGLVFMNKYFKNSALYEKFIKAAEVAYNRGEAHYEIMMGVLRALQKSPMDASSNDISQAFEGQTYDKIFISHSSSDAEYVEQIIQLLNDIGIPKNKESIFCSSFEGYGIPLGEKIYDYLKDQFNQNILVLPILSDNYYSSTPCLNEMGATWVTARDYHSILLPGFEFSRINGAIDPTKICFRIDDFQKLNSFKDKILDKFELPDIDGSIWERDRNKFVATIQQIALHKKPTMQQAFVDLVKVKKYKENQIKLEFRFVNKSNIPVEFQDVTISLIGDNNFEFEICLPSTYLDGKLIYGYENRREVIELALPDTQVTTKNFQINKISSTFETAF
jgi:hypothetical protein